MPPRFIPPDPEEEAQRQWAIDHPWERPSFVAPTIDPRQSMMEDMATAYETAKARTSNPRLLGAGINLDSPQAIDQQVFNPVRQQWGIASPQGVSKSPPVYHVGNSLVQFGPDGKPIVVFEPPAKAPPASKEPLFEIPTGFDGNGKPTSKQKLTKSQILEALPNLASDVRATDAIKVALGKDYASAIKSVPHFMMPKSVDGSASGVLNSAPSFVPPTIKTNSPYRDGTELQGPGGKLYVVRNGIPVLK